MRRRYFLAAGGALAAFATVKGCAPSPTPPAPGPIEARWPPLGEIIPTPFGDVHLVEYPAPAESAGLAPVVLIHGASGNLRDFTFRIAPKLAQTRRVIAVDRPGFGYSERRDTAEGWRPEAQAAQIRAALTARGVGRPVVLGHSWGGAVALAWALDAPETVSGVIPVSAVSMPWGGLATVLGDLGLRDAVVGLYSDRLLSRAEEGGIDAFVARAFRPQAPPEGYVDYIGGPLAIREGTLRANEADLANINAALQEMAPRYGGLRAPLEIVHGAADWLLDVEQHARGLAEMAPDAGIEILPGVGHMAHHAAPEALERALARIDARRA